MGKFKFPDNNEKNVDVESKIANWGSVKFKPTNNANTNPNNPFKKSQGFGHTNQTSFQRHDNRKKGFERKKPYDRIQFNPVDRNARPDNATPWTKFKDEITSQQREEVRAKEQPDMTTEEGKAVLKQREMNYRKMLMLKKQNEPTHWEDFGEENSQSNGDADKKNTKPLKKFKDDKASKKNKKNKIQKSVASSKKPEKAEKGDFQEVDSQPNEVAGGKNTQKFKDDKASKKKKKHNKKLKSDASPKNTEKEGCVSKELHNNVDATKLSFEQKDRMRQLLTMGSNRNSTSLGLSVKNRKQQLKKKQKINKSTN